MENLTELRTELSEVFAALRKGELNSKKAKEINNAAGKMISSVKAQLEYAAMRQEKPNIPFCS